MISIAISILFGFAAFAALLSASVSVVRGVKAGQAILCDLAELDAAAGVSRPRRTLRPNRRQSMQLQAALA